MKLYFCKFAAVLIVSASIGCKSSPSPDGSGAHGGTAGAAGERPVPVTISQVVARDTPVYLEGLGSVTGYYTVTVKTQVDGRIMRVAFREGQDVKKGDLLAQIDPRPIEIALHQAEAALARDTAQLKNARLNLERNRVLRQKNLVPQQTVDDAAALADQLDGTVMGDQAQIDNAKLQLVYAAITSPIDGRTGLRQVDPGNVVHAADNTGLVVITQVDPIAVLFTLPEDDLPRVAEEMQQHKLQVTALSRDGKTELGKGEVQLIDNQINQTTGTVKLKAVCANPNNALWPNQFVKVRLQLKTLKDALVMPSSVVQHGPQGTFAYVVDDAQSVQAKPIEVDIAEGETVIVTKGLNVGDRVVADGQYQLHPGSRVVVK